MSSALSNIPSGNPRPASSGLPIAPGLLTPSGGEEGVAQKQTSALHQSALATTAVTQAVVEMLDQKSPASTMASLPNGMPVIPEPSITMDRLLSFQELYFAFTENAKKAEVNSAIASAKTFEAATAAQQEVYAAAAAGYQLAEQEYIEAEKKALASLNTLSQTKETLNQIDAEVARAQQQLATAESELAVIEGQLAADPQNAEFEEQKKLKQVEVAAYQKVLAGAQERQSPAQEAVRLAAQGAMADSQQLQSASAKRQTASNTVLEASAAIIASGELVANDVTEEVMKKEQHYMARMMDMQMEFIETTKDLSMAVLQNDVDIFEEYTKALEQANAKSLADYQAQVKSQEVWGKASKFILAITAVIVSVVSLGAAVAPFVTGAVAFTAMSALGAAAVPAIGTALSMTSLGMIAAGQEDFMDKAMSAVMDALIDLSGLIADGLQSIGASELAADVIAGILVATIVITAVVVSSVLIGKLSTGALKSMGDKVAKYVSYPCSGDAGHTADSLIGGGCTVQRFCAAR